MIGRIVSHYKILAKLGEGGMGVVYKAEDLDLKREVAIKFLPQQIAASEEERKRFKIEAQAAAALNHPNIAHVYAIEEHDGEMFIVMEYIDGRELQKAVVCDQLPVNDVIGIAMQIAEGLKAAHAKGIVHRDIKTSNIMITKDGKVKIMDFGLAKIGAGAQLTQEGMTLGTVSYMSPEQARGENVDHRTDIWAFGVVLYEMLTGELPFKSHYEQAVIYSIMNEEPEPLIPAATASGREGVFPELEQIVNKALAKDPDERYQKMDDVLHDLKQLSQESGTSGNIQRRKVVRRAFRDPRIKRLSLVSAIMLALVVGIFLLRPFFFEEALVSEPRRIAVISFENQTGNASYDYLQKAIPNLLITSLEQSGELRVATWERLRDLSKQAGKKDIEIIDPDWGFELCRMDGINMIVLGSFTKAGDVFATDVKVLEVQSKKLLKSASSQGEGIASILKSQINELSRHISLGAGVSEQKITATQQPIAEATTSSMEAYNYFLRGREDFEKGYYDDARKFLDKAVKLDTTFAVAYLYLAWTYDELADPRQSKALYEKAKKYSEKATEKDRLLVETYYARHVEQDIKKHVNLLKEIVEKYPQEKAASLHLAGHTRGHTAIQLYKKILELDPSYGPAMKGLAFTYTEMGDLDRAEEYLQKYASVSPGDAEPFESMAELYFKRGKLDAALAKYKEAIAVKPDFGSDWIIAYIYAMQEKYGEAMNWIDQHIARAPSPGLKAEGFHWKGFYHYWLGSYDLALRDFDAAISISEKIGHQGDVALVNSLKAWLYYETGDFQLGQRLLKRCTDVWSKLYPEWQPNNRIYFNYYRGFVDLKEGRTDSAEARLAEMKSILSGGWMPWKSESAYLHDLLKTEIFLAKDPPEKAIAFYKKNVSSEFPEMTWAFMINHNLFSGDVLAQAYKQKGDLDQAIAEYERLITFDPKGQERLLIRPTYHYRLAKLYEQRGWPVKAIKEYEKVLDIWKDADKDLPELIDARARLVRLLSLK